MVTGFFIEEGDVSLVSRHLEVYFRILQKLMVVIELSLLVFLMAF